MPRFAANVSMLFTERPLLDRLDAAARAGFVAVEMQFPYALPAARLRERLQACGLTLVMHNLPAGDFAAGERGMACHPGREAEFREGLARAVDYALTLEVGQLNCLAGKRLDGVDEATMQSTLLDNLCHAAEVLGSAGLQLLVEPLNAWDAPGFLLDRPSKAFAAVESVRQRVGTGHVRVQYDLYHAQRSEGELASTLARYLPAIGHVQVADNPGRHEPGTGEIAWDFLFDHLDRIGYEGWVGCEYVPLDGTEAGLAWWHRWQERSR